MSEPKARTRRISFLAPDFSTKLTILDEAPLKQPRVDIGEYRAKALAVDLGEYPLRQFRMETPCESTAQRPAKSLLRWVQYLFVLVGLLGAGVYGWYYAEARVYQAYESWRLNQMAKHDPADLRAFLVSHFGGSAIQTTKELPAPVKGPTELHRSLPPVPLPVGALIGRIEIPRLSLSTVVLQGDSDEVLRKGVGHIPNTSLPGGSGNVAIAGHRDTFFRALKDIRRDDDITVATTAGTYHYRVDSVQVVRPNETHVLEPSQQASLTLVTCYPFRFIGAAPKRYIVHAQQIGSSRVGNQSVCQTQLGPGSDGSGDGCPSAATVVPTPVPPDRPPSDGRAESGETHVDGGLFTDADGVLSQIKITLRDICPPIWWRIRVCGNEILTELGRERDRVKARIEKAVESYMNGDD